MSLLDFQDSQIAPGDHDLGFGQDGLPTIASLANAIQVWSILQIKQPVTVGEAAQAFNVPAARVQRAVRFHHFMYLERGAGGATDDQIICHEGE